MAVGNASSTRRHQQIVKMMLAVLGLFVVLAGPWHVADIILDLGGRDGRPMPASVQLVTREVVALLMFVNGWAMPIVYTSSSYAVVPCTSSCIGASSTAFCLVVVAVDMYVTVVRAAGPAQLQGVHVR